MNNQEHEAEVVNEQTGEVLAPFQRGAAMTRGETSVGALAEQARAQVEARFLIALHRPRDIDRVRVVLLKECARPGFAETARYRRPAGRKKDDQTGEWKEVFIEGPSIRFAEAAIRQMGNVDVQSPTIYEDDEKLIARALVTDLETNTTYSRDILIHKIVEKRSLKKGQKPIDVRVNSYGDTVYMLPATESEVEMKLGAAVSKSIRTLGLRLVPGDVLEECMEKCVAVRNAKIKADPDGERKRMIDGFAALGVMPDALKGYVGQELTTLSPAQIGDLRDLYLAIKDGVTTWADVQRARSDESGVATEGKSAMDALRDKTRAHAEEVKAGKATGATVPTEVPGGVTAPTQDKPTTKPATKAKPFKFTDGPYKGQAPTELGTDVLQSLVDKGGLSAAALAAIDGEIESRIQAAPSGREPGDEGEG